MLNRYSFKAQITWLSTSLILLTVISLTASYWLRITEYAESQVKNQLLFAENVLNQNLVSQEKMLTTAARVLAADFGFKQAVASRDSNTINSVLLNHGERINADLMMLIDVDGQLVSTSASKPLENALIEDSIKSLPLIDVHAQFLSIDNFVYQVIVVPVKAPRTIGYSVIGFEVNKASLLQLKELILLDISLIKGTVLMTSTMVEQIPGTQLLSQATSPPSNLLWSRDDFYHQVRPLADSNEINVILSAPLAKYHRDFYQLVYSILVIALFVIFIAIALSKLLSRGMAKPLHSLMKLTERVGRGDLNVPKLTTDLPVEFSELYQSFSVMGAAIKSREKEIKFQAERDMLTGLYNRQKILQQVTKSMNEKQKLSLIAFNIKGFKALNDTIGLINGDNILKVLAQRISQYLKPIDGISVNVKGIARLNADEFLLVLEQLNKTQINHFLEHLLLELNRPYWINDIKITIALSFGVVLSEDNNDDAECLLRRASMTVAAANQDQSQIRFYQTGEDEAYLNKLALIDELKSALEQPESPMFMVYQPKLNIKTGKIDKLEALIRWINLKGEFVNPELFIDLAEKSGLIVNLTRWVILQVVIQIKSWVNQGYQFKVSINLSAQDIQHDTFVEYLLDTLSAHQVTPESITLELTERDLAENESLVITRLTYLKSLGFQISVDDYGIGQSSLAKLKQLPVDELKIDKEFILNLDSNKQDQDITSSTILLGHKLGLSVVAEGVETQASLALLADYQCNYAQGYYLSKPLKSNELIQWYIDYDNKTLP
ncbi:EAL domain-containing protein [Colwellia sp. RSH04]|uniref:EAL domain-containing protein n=1 Tax=Colwellia sp. RSH04 TaxID=2305464 RepID=UPI000E596635|nr:EAL domain-containing protein [Colwellia sp. RSH04]RHW75093.1 EAL domain-containing protein [Colwellia sp. RSH04]